MRQLKTNILLPIITVLILFLSSCLNSSSVNENLVVEDVQVLDTPGISDSLIAENVPIKTELIDLVKLKLDLDSFVINYKRVQLPFDLNTDTVSVKSSDKDLWAFQKGIFELINVDSTKLLVRHHFSIPKTKNILRIYLLELHYPNIEESNKFFRKLDSRKDYEADLTDGYFIYYGLTGTTDYVIKSNETILWFNVSCQYTKIEFDKLIEIFRKDAVLNGSEEIIKVYCQKKYE